MPPELMPQNRVHTAAPFRSPGARRALLGFFVSGLLLSFLGAVLPSWGYHLGFAYITVGEYFLASALGLFACIRPAQILIRTRGIRAAIVTGCVAASASLLYLALVSPPAPAWARMIGLFFIGAAAATLHLAIFHAISPMYQHDPASTVNLGGAMFGLGCLTVALLISGTFYVYTVPSILVLLAIIPGLFAGIFWKSEYAAVEPEARRPISEVLQELRSPSAVLFALLLFFQFGNEWSIAGWLPLFLVQRLGISPEKSLLLLALYWLALLVGRIVAQSFLTSVSHAKLLIGSVFAALFGCLILSFTDNRFGAMMAILFLGGGFAMIYPLVVEKIGNRFPYYHPGFYNGIFSFAFAGGLLAPCSLGWFADLWDIRAVVVLPLLGTGMVLLLLAAIWVETRLPAHGRTTEVEPAGPS